MNLSRPAGFLSGWNCLASLRYADLSSSSAICKQRCSHFPPANLQRFLMCNTGVAWRTIRAGKQAVMLRFKSTADTVKSQIVFNVPACLMWLFYMLGFTDCLSLRDEDCHGHLVQEGSCLLALARLDAKHSAGVCLGHSEWLACELSPPFIQQRLPGNTQQFATVHKPWQGAGTHLMCPHVFSAHNRSKETALQLRW